MSLSDFWRDLDARVAKETAEYRRLHPDRTIYGTLSPDRSRTLRAKARIANGYHPMGVRLREPAGETCGSCKHIRSKEYAGKYFKCALMRDTNGPGTDIRKKWPACMKWEAP